MSYNFYSKPFLPSVRGIPTKERQASKIKESGNTRRKMEKKTGLEERMATKHGAGAGEPGLPGLW